MSEQPCWVFRWEAERRPGESDEQAIGRVWDEQAARFDTDDAMLRGYEAAQAMCDLDDRHDGSHQFVNQDEIVLAFA